MNWLKGLVAKFLEGLTLGRIAIFLWISLICIVGLFYESDPTSWGQGSFLEQFASQFPGLFAFVAAIFLLPLYVLSVLLSSLQLVGLYISIQLLTTIQLVIGAIYLFWLSGVLAKRVRSAH